MHIFLLGAQIVDQITQVSINPIERLELDVHVVGLCLKLYDFVLTRGNVSLQVFDFIIKHKLELFKLLCLPFQSIDLLLTN